MTSSNGAEALEILEKHKDIDMVTLDMEMPILDGRKVVFELRQKEEFLNLPILILSGTKDKDLIVRTIKNGANDFMKKPFSIEEFILKCESLINLYSAQKELHLLNQNLEERVAVELEKNREKDKVMIQQSRLASMGEMISNIAHQWRQPLSSLSLIVQDLQDAYIHEELNREYIDGAVESSVKIIDFMSKTIDDFRNFFKPNKAKELFDVNQVINSSLELINATLKSKNIIVDKNLADFEIMVFGYPNEFSQVIINIIKNAEDVILQREKSIKVITIKTYRDKEQAFIEISDSGGGVSIDNIHKIFDPYFSTKHKAQGTGIGLYMSKQIIESHMGGILSVSNSEIGAIFKIKLSCE
jgi:signal transduction histidine kinase